MDRPISIVISTRNRAAHLARCLDAIGRIDPRPVCELIVVDNGSTDDTAAVFEQFRNAFAFPATLLSEPRPGACRARNRAILAAQGDIVAFTDDDCYPAQDWAVRTAAVFENPAIGYIGGRIHLYDESDARFTVNYSEDVHILPPHGFVPAGVIQGANMAFRRDLLIGIGLFDEAIGAGTPYSAEDCDLVARACLAGAVGGYFPGPLVYHHHGRKEGDLDELRAYYDIGRGYYYAKFILRRGSSMTWARNWLHITRTEFSKAPGPTIRRTLREIRGAAHYLAKPVP